MCFTTAIPFRYSNRGFFFWDLQASVCSCAVLCCSFAGMLWRYHFCCQKLSWVGMHVCCLNWRCFSWLHILFLPIWFGGLSQGVSLARRFALVPLGPPLLAYKSNCKAMLKAVGDFVQLEVDRPYHAGEPIVVWYVLHFYCMKVCTATYGSGCLLKQIMAACQWIKKWVQSVDSCTPWKVSYEFWWW